VRATTARIQTTRLLEKLERLEIILFNTFVKALKFYQKACGLNSGSGCSILGYLYGRGKGVKQDDFKALKFYQKACDLNNGTGCSNLGFMSRLLVKLERLEIILFNAFAFFIHKSKIRATSTSIFTKRRVV
jgi:dihydroorotase